MALLADAGTGNFYYVPDPDVLAGIFANEFESARQTVASALEIRIDTPEGVELLDAAGYPIERRSDHALVRPGSLFSGQKRSFWVTLRVPAHEAGQVVLGDVLLAYNTLDGRRQRARLAAFPPIAAVVDKTQFVGRLDADAVQSHHAEDLVNRLRQSVSGLVASGEYGAARARLDAVDFDELEALGIDPKDTESFRDVEALKREVERAAAAPAAEQSAVRSQLGKTLYESGTDGRRKGAKLEPSPAP